MKDKLFIIGGGQSLENFDFWSLKNQEIIAVNKSILDVPFAKYFLTMDYTFIDKKIDKNLFNFFPAIKYFVITTHNDYIVYKNDKYIDIRTKYVYDLSLFNKVIPSNKDIGIGNSFDKFVHGCNSGFSALQLGLLLNYKEIYLLGIDLECDIKTHYHTGYNLNKVMFEQNLKIYKNYFIEGLKEIKVKFKDVNIYSCSPNSPLNDFLPVKDLKEILNDV